jgi:hypothetical protein
MSFRYFFLLALLMPAGAALAEGSDTETSKVVADTAVSGSKPGLSVKMQALLETITTPEMALEEAKKYQQNGQFGLAKIVLQHGIELAKSSGKDFIELSDEMEYAMPLLEAKELMITGKPDQAEEILQALAEQFGSDYRRNNEINALLGAMSQSRALAAAKRNNEREVTKSVRGRLSEYYRKNDVFPNYAQLNILLPPGDEVLQNYEIIYYKVVPNAYRLVLRNLHNSENLLKIEATGLIK